MYKYLIIILSLLAFQSDAFADPQDPAQLHQHASEDHAHGACGIEHHT